MQTSFESHKKLANTKEKEGRKQYQWSALRARHLAELNLTLGNIPQALEFSKQSVELANTSHNKYEAFVERTVLASVCHHRGDDTGKVQTLFKDATEKLTDYTTKQDPVLYSLWGFRYCEFLLHDANLAAFSDDDKLLCKANADTEEALKLVCAIKRYRAKFDPDERIDEEDGLGLVGTGLEYFCDVNTRFLRAVIRRSAFDLAQHTAEFNEALKRLRSAGRRDFIPYPLIAQSRHWCVALDREVAHCDRDETERLIQNALNEAIALATGGEHQNKRGTMQLHLADCYIAQSWYHVIVGNADAAQLSIDDASEIVMETGYGRRKHELEMLNQRLRCLK